MDYLAQVCRDPAGTGSVMAVFQERVFSPYIDACCDAEHRATLDDQSSWIIERSIEDPLTDMFILYDHISDAIADVVAGSYRRL